jgi:reverse gyrase
MVEMRGIYYGLCINCKGAISDERLLKLGICKRCIESVKGVSWKRALRILKEKGNLYFASELLDFYTNLKEFSTFFKKAIGQKMWSLQETWARRILLKRNFSIVAPTGVGKTVLGIITSLYFSNKGKKSYIIVPTALLVQQSAERIEEFSKKLGINPRVVYFHTALTKKEREKAVERILNNDFEILITTERFLISRFEIFNGKKFDFVFVDDVDSFLKSPKNIDRILSILGFNQEIINLAFQLIELRKEANRQIRMGRSAEQILKQMESIREKIENYKQNNNIGLLVVSGATLKAKRTKRIRLFEELLKFQIGFKPEFLRNIKDFYLEGRNVEKQVLDLIRNFGPGCLVFVPSPLGKEYALKINKFLNENGIRSNVYMKMDEELLSKFENGEYDVLIGVATFRSPLARGVDLPERIRYVIFAGVPRMEIRLSWEEYNPSILLTLLKNIREFLEKDDQEKAIKIINNLKSVVPIDKQTLQKVKDSIEKGILLSEYEDYVKRIVLEARDFIKNSVTSKVIERIMQSKEVSLTKKDKDIYLIVSDPIAYVQASGRASRMFAGGITHGASFLVVDDEKAFYSLKRKLEFILEESTWTKFKQKNAEKWFKKIEEDRKLIRDIAEGKIVKKIKDFIKAALLVVESPTKARTISRFFGKPYKRKIGNVTVFEVSTGNFLLNIIPSMGHVYDLVVEEGFHGVVKKNEKFVPIFDFIKKCKNCGEQFTEFEFCPKCKSQEFFSKSELIDAMRKVALEVNTIFIATDPDREGEKIAYDIFCSLYPLNKKIERLEFHEITKKAFLQAIKNKRKINLKMVEAQIVRRIEDRWIGFELSQRLWHVFKNYKLSAGRVQTPVLKWIIERVKESKKKKKVLSIVLSNGLRVSLENPVIKFPIDTTKIKARITDLKNEEKSLNPLPPYTTDTLLRDASAKLNFSATKTMRIAQDLFEMGLCTYHRTDSTTVSTTGMNIAKTYIQEKYPSLFSPRKYFVPGAHECIRPTRPLDCEQLKNLISTGILRFPKKLSNDHFQLYDLIFRRFIASQMKEVKLLYQKFKILINGNQTSIENPVRIVSDGFNLVIPIKLFASVIEGEYKLKFAKLLFLPLALPFTQGEIISLMKEKGIGRPSTYAKIVATLLERKYVAERKNRLTSTLLGFKVCKYLCSRFAKYISEETTKRLESLMDMIEEGKVNYEKVIEGLYKEILEIRKKPTYISDYKSSFQNY